MRLRFGLPLTLLVWIATMALSWATAVPLYWPVVAVIALLCTRDAVMLEAREYPTSFALPPLGIFVVLTVAWPIAFPWYLRVRRQIRTGELQRGAARVGWIAYGVAAGSAGLALAGYLMTKKVQSSPMIATLTSTAQAVADSCYVALTTRYQTNGTLELLLSADQLPIAEEHEAFARRLAMVARRVYPNADSLRAIDVLFLEVTRRGDVTTTKQAARFGYWPKQLDMVPEGPAVEAMDERAARGFAARLIVDDATLWDLYRPPPGLADSAVPIDSLRKNLRPLLPPRAPDAMHRIACLSYHGNDGARRTRLGWAIDSTKWVVDFWLRGAADSIYFVGFNLTKY